MKRFRKLTLCALAVLSGAALFAGGPASRGAEPGVWTTDLEAAKALAAAKNLPVLLNFTGSDWCHWCKEMDRLVFSTDTWQAYAREHLVLVLIDKPKDRSLTTPELEALNAKRREEYGVKGFPTFVILTPDGREAGRSNAERGATPESFIEGIRRHLVTADIGQYLSAEEAAEYASLTEALQAWQKRAEEVYARHDARFRPHIAKREALDAEGDALVDKAVAAANRPTLADAAGTPPVTPTDDFGAAKALAREKGLPILLRFVGKSWCPWCRQMEEQIFRKPEWQAYAAKYLITVDVDLPKGDRAPETEEERAKAALCKEFGLRGVPSYFVLTPEGVNCGMFGATTEASPETAVRDIDRRLVAYDIGRYLSEEDTARVNAVLRAQEAWREEANRLWAEHEIARKPLDAEFQTLNGRLRELRRKACEAAGVKAE